MSAVFGLLRRDGAMAAARDVDRMANALAHFARDGCDTVVLGELGLGVCRTVLRAFDLRDVQPVSDPAGHVTLAASVRLDAREPLGAELGIDPDQLAQLPDSALLLQAYLRWGDAFATHLLGDFVIAIWDERRRRLLLVRDHMGQRDLFYHLGEDMLAFAPDIAGLWALADVPRALDDAMLCSALTQEFVAPPGATLFHGIQTLAGGHMLIAEPGRPPVIRCYWEPTADPVHLDRDEAYYVEAYARVLGEAIADRLTGLSHAPGMLLSGGYDSSAIAGLARAPLARSGQQMTAAASVMPPGYSGTIRHAGPWVDLCERDMPWIAVRRVTREGLDPLEAMTTRLAERHPLPSPYGAVNDALYGELAGAEVRLAMDGHGGDYTLNPLGSAALARWLAIGRLRRFWRELRAHRRLTGQSIAAAMQREVVPRLLPKWMRRWRMRRSAGPGLAVQPAFVASFAMPSRRALPDLTDMHGPMLATLNHVRSGSGSAAAYARHGLILTRPFHDKRVVELALAIPQDLYVKDGRNRYLACQALRHIYPAEFQQRGRRRDDLFPDFQAAIHRAKPEILADIDRMEASASLTAMIDFPRLRALLHARGADDHNSGWEAETHAAMNAYSIARYVEWFRRDNR